MCHVKPENILNSFMHNSKKKTIIGLTINVKSQMFLATEVKVYAF
jgi:hypothetical protein